MGSISKPCQHQATILWDGNVNFCVRQGDAVEYRIERGEVKVKRVTAPHSSLSASSRKRSPNGISKADNDASKTF
jgi:hypothetical protein